MGNNISKGKLGELTALKYLTTNGYKILNTNYKTKIGEIDIIALYNNLLVVLEVKTRTSLNHGYPYEAVNQRKQNKIIMVSQIYMKEKGFKDIQVRFDIIEVYLTKSIKINHIENAFCQLS